MEGIFHYQGLSYISKIIRSKLISHYHNDPLASHFGIKKTRELVTGKYFLLTLHQDIKDYAKDFNVYLTLKAICHKPYGDL